MKIPSIEQLKKRDYQPLLESTYPKKLDSQKAYIFGKRLIDLFFSVCALVIFAPLWLVLILSIRLDSPGKAIFSHQRVGKNGKLFRFYKFRTMYKSASQEEFAPLSLSDPRITRIGKFLRRTSLDEVPQCFNVLKGEMSLVGPRPEMNFIVKEYTILQRARLLVKPGVTGLWQIAGRKDLPLHQNVEYDLFYIQNRSILMDLKILWSTISVVIKGKGAY